MDLLVVDVPVIISDKFQQSIVYEDVEVPQIQFIDRVVDLSVVLQRRVPTVQTVQKTGEIPQLQFLDRCQVGTEQKTVEVPQLQCSDKVDDVPVVQVVVQVEGASDSVHRQNWIMTAVKGVFGLFGLFSRSSGFSRS